MRRLDCKAFFISIVELYTQYVNHQERLQVKRVNSSQSNESSTSATLALHRPSQVPSTTTTDHNIKHHPNKTPSSTASPSSGHSTCLHDLALALEPCLPKGKDTLYRYFYRRDKVSFDRNTVPLSLTLILSQIGYRFLAVFSFLSCIEHCND